MFLKIGLLEVRTVLGLSGSRGSTAIVGRSEYPTSVWEYKFPTGQNTDKTDSTV
jgi:hypothetical protein